MALSSKEIIDNIHGNCNHDNIYKHESKSSSSKQTPSTGRDNELDSEISIHERLYKHIDNCHFTEDEVLSASLIKFNQQAEITNYQQPDELCDFLKSAPIATMTVIYSLSAKVNINMLYPLLHVTQVKDPNPHSKTQKTPLYSETGHILSIRYDNKYRGFVPRPLKNIFRNSMTIDVSTGRKNVSMKLSPSTIQQCGAASLQNGIAAVEYLLQHIRQVYEMLQYMHEHYDDLCQVVQWCRVVCKGGKFTAHCHSLIKPNYIPKNLNMRIVDYVLSYMENYHNYDFHIAYRLNDEYDNKKKIYIEYSIYESFMFLLDHCLVVTKNFQRADSDETTPTLADSCITNDNNKINKIILHPHLLLEDLQTVQPVDNVWALQARTSMVNQKFSLETRIKRKELARHFYHLTSFFVNYDNDVNDQVSIQIPYGPKMVGNKKISCITISVSRTGSVTITGPNELYNYLTYRIFINELINILPKIAIS